MKQEIWKVIENYPMYEVSSFGNVRKVSNGCMLKQCLDSKGYPSVNLNDGRKRSLKVVHRLVAQAFVANEQNKPYVDHIDGNRTNNNVSNVRWVTAKENSNNPNTIKKLRDVMKNKTFNDKRWEARKKRGGKTAPKTIYMYDRYGNFIKEFLSITMAAKEFSGNNATISVALDSNTRTAYGYKWRSHKIEPL